MLRVLFSLFVVLSFSGIILAQISGTAHDFRGETWYGGDEICEVCTANFLFAFDQNFNVDGQLFPGFEKSLDNFEIDENLSLVVGCTPGEHLAVFERGLEGWCFPFSKRFNRLYVVMAVNKYGWSIFGIQPFAVYERVPLGGVLLDMF